MRSNNGQTRIKLMTFGIESESVKGARSRLTRIGLDMQGNFKKIGVESVLMDGKERLSLLHALFHMDDHAPFVFEWSWLPETGLSTKDFIGAPGALISRRPARLRSGKHIAPRRTSRFKRRA